jgi:hypothetical protein
MRTVKDSTSKKLLFIGWVIFGVLISLDFFSLYKVSIYDFVGNYPFEAPRRFALLLTAFIVFICFWLFLLNRWINFSAKKEILIQPNPFFTSLPKFLRYLIIIVILVLITAIFIFPRPNDYITSYWIKVSIYIFTCLFMAYFLLNQKTNLKDFFITASIIFVFSSFIFLIISIFLQISRYPFSLYWSEGNRFWDYSLAFGKSRYLFLESRSIFAYIEPGRQLLWGLPFLIRSLAISGMRLWNSVLWVAPSMLLGFSISILENGKDKLKAFFVAIWFFIFLNQGPIYAPLLISAIIIYFASKTENKIFTVFFIVLSSFIASISRWTWAYVPSVWISILLILKIKGPIFRKHNIKNLIWVFICSSISLLSGQINRIIDVRTAVFDNNPVNIIQIPLSLKQPLLFERLFPNSIFSLGLLIGIILAVVPILLFIFYLLKQEFKNDFFQYFYSSFMLLILFIIGCIASIKIGGGSNLHNFDMFLVTIGLLISTVINKIHFKELINSHYFSPLIIFFIIALISPALFSFQNNQKLFFYDETKINSVLNDIKYEVTKKKDLGEILFMDQRQLLTFGYINNVPLVDDYEKKLLMDKSLSSDYLYFDNFYKDLFGKRFSLIVNENSSPTLIGSDYGFSNENNLYSLRVLQPLLCFYEPLKTYKDEGIQLLIPRDQPLETYNNSQCPSF